MTIRFNHAWTDTDKVYFKSPNRPLIIIGAGSYTGKINIYDYQPTMSEDQEDSEIHIGRFSSLGDDITIQLYGNHLYSSVTTSPLMPFVGNYKEFITASPKEDVVIGSDVWIGNGARILSGMTIGNGAVIGAGSIVAKDVPPYAIAVGAPAKVIKYRFSSENIYELEKIKWWNWSLQKIKENARLLLSGSIDDFIMVHKDVGA